MWLRFWRLYPLHFAFLFVFVGIEGAEWLKEWWIKNIGDLAAFGGENNYFSLITNVLLIHSLGIHDTLTYNRPSWSISTEFYTYLLFGIVMCLISSPVVRRIVAFGLVVSSLGLLLSVGKKNLGIYVDYGFFRCVAGFFIGVLTYDLYRYGQEKRERVNMDSFIGFSQAAILIGIILFLGIKNKGYSDYAILPLVSLLVLATAYVPDSLTGKILGLKPLRWCGKVSYSIYMTHPAVLWVFYRILKYGLNTPVTSDLKMDKNLLNPSPMLGAIYCLLAIASVFVVSECTYRWIEDPFRKWAKTRQRKNVVM